MCRSVNIYTYINKNSLNYKFVLRMIKNPKYYFLILLLVVSVNLTESAYLKL